MYRHVSSRCASDLKLASRMDSVRPQTPSGRIVASLASVTHTPQTLQPYVCTSLSLLLSGTVRARPMGLPQLGHMCRKVDRSPLIMASVTEAKFPRIYHQFRG